MSLEGAQRADRLRSDGRDRTYGKTGHLRLAYSRDWEDPHPVIARRRDWTLVLTFMAGLAGVAVPVLFWLML